MRKTASVKKAKTYKRCGACRRTIPLTARGKFQVHTVGGLTQIKTHAGPVGIVRIVRTKLPQCVNSGKKP